ncbi:hypothetical protein CVS40_6009 [Lucilia cuprina]|nr:hypothetical protein CVS40_6009 [Lucilia cuprina]
MDENVLKELVKTRNVLKKKFRSIKIGEEDTHKQLKDTFKPITEPLNDFIKKSRNLKKISKIEKNDIKNENTNDTNFMSNKLPLNVDTSTPKKIREDTLVNSVNYEDDDDDDNDDYYSQSENENLNIDMNDADLLLLEKLNELDNLYGPHKDSNNEWYFGDSKIKFNGDKIEIGNQIWALTPGLFSLMFHKTPKNYDKSELEIYKKILINTNAYKRHYKPDGQIKGTKAYKYQHIIGKLFKGKNEKQLAIESTPSHEPTKRNYMGTGLMKLNLQKPSYIYWDNPNELVDRLRLLMASQAAGHTNHNNEIVSIIEELYEANIIH